MAEAQRGKILGATHGSEIPYAFDAVGAIPKNQASAADLAMGQTMSAYWVAFVQTAIRMAAAAPNGRASTRQPATC